MKKNINTTNLEKAFTSLEAALNPPPANDRERDGAIQRFEYTFEVLWQTARKFLENEGIVCSSPRMVIREMFKLQWIVDADKWMEFLRARNYTAHLYNEEIAKEVFDQTLKFAKECKVLIQNLKKL